MMRLGALIYPYSMTTILKEMIVLLWTFHPYILPLHLALAILYILLFKIIMVTCTDKLKSSKVWCNYNYDDCPTDAVVVFNTSCQSVGEEMMEVSVCVNSGIKGSVDIPLMVTLNTTEGLASEFK